MTRAAAPSYRSPKPRRHHRAGRLRAAWDLVSTGRVLPLQDGTFKVAGNEEPFYIVDLTQEPTCHCRDMEYRGGGEDHQCKHTLAARMAAKDPSLLSTLMNVFLANDDEQP